MATKVQNRQVNGQANYKRAAPIFNSEDHKMHMLIAAMDYKRTGRVLTSTVDARSMEELARQCNVNSLLALYEEECNKESVLAAIREIGSKCGPDDFFIFYYAGYGSGLDEESAEQSFVFVDRRTRQTTQETLLSSDDFCRTVVSSCHMETRILIMTDLCHHRSIVNLDLDDWTGRQVVSLSGSQDAQGMDDTSRCGIFTHSLLLGVDKLSKVGRDNYSVGMLFNAMLDENQNIFSGKQDITIQTPVHFTPDLMAWPLVSQRIYQAPLSRCAGPGGILRNAPLVGISPQMLPHVIQEALNVPVSVEEYIQHVQGQSGMFFKPCRGCAAGGAAAGCVVQ